MSREKKKSFGGNNMGASKQHKQKRDFSTFLSKNFENDRAVFYEKTKSLRKIPLKRLNLRIV